MKPNDELKSGHVLLIHVLVWTLLFGLPIIYGIENEGAFRFARRNCVMLVGLLVTFYANFLWGNGKLLFRGRYVWFILFNILLFVAVSAIRGGIDNIIDDIESLPRCGHGKACDIRPLFVFNDIIFSLLAICASIGVNLLVNMNRLEIERKRIESETLKSELELLRYQIRPHFFFNCLNNIYSLIGSSPQEAQKAVHSLSRMMRFILYDGSKQLIPLAQEVDFLGNYISLMRLKLRPGASVRVVFPSHVDDVEIPSLLFIPLVENAFKHGVGGHGEADIVCEMRIERELSFRVVNKVFEANAERDASHSGIGLVNLRKRLDIIYGDAYSFTLRFVIGGGTFEACVRIPISTKT